ncbi:MAG: hypothetical protein E5X34_09580 [Mesorhizobium sp.]|nr:MAG: hypothetical protein E5X34_09580 [Mesorhizobium sp.]
MRRSRTRSRRRGNERLNACRPKSAQRFWENDMHQNKDLKRVARIRFDATRFRLGHAWPPAGSARVAEQRHSV